MEKCDCDRNIIGIVVLWLLWYGTNCSERKKREATIWSRLSAETTSRRSIHDATMKLKYSFQFDNGYGRQQNNQISYVPKPARHFSLTPFMWIEWNRVDRVYRLPVAVNKSIYLPFEILPSSMIKHSNPYIIPPKDVIFHQVLCLENEQPAYTTIGNPLRHKMQIKHVNGFYDFVKNSQFFVICSGTWLPLWICNYRCVQLRCSGLLLTRNSLTIYLMRTRQCA